VAGVEHLTERRPAVFLFNFRSNVDIFLVAALVKDNWTGVATKELMSSHVFGQLGKMLDVAFEITARGPDDGLITFVSVSGSGVRRPLPWKGRHPA
jgi:hypothetical protein